MCLRQSDVFYHNGFIEASFAKKYINNIHRLNVLIYRFRDVSLQLLYISLTFAVIKKYRSNLGHLDQIIPLKIVTKGKE